MAEREIKNKYVIWKNLGETPLEALNQLAETEGIPKEIPLTYAGRLDPAAEGLLIVLAGEECKKKDEYTKLSKIYMAEILVGVSTDSFDLLGVPKCTTPAPLLSKVGEDTILKKVQEYLDSHIGKFEQKYPHYSSKHIDTGMLPPPHEVELISYEDLSLEEVEREDLLVRVGEVVASVTGDFRQAEIAQAWAELETPEKLQLIEVTLTVGSGFYIRQLAEDIGRELGTGACLYSLVRTEIGGVIKNGHPN
jgi:tRNA pseudouridine55 synthase